MVHYLKIYQVLLSDGSEINEIASESELLGIGTVVMIRTFETPFQSVDKSLFTGKPTSLFHTCHWPLNGERQS